MKIYIKKENDCLLYSNTSRMSWIVAFVYADDENNLLSERKLLPVQYSFYRSNEIFKIESQYCVKLVMINCFKKMWIVFLRIFRQNRAVSNRIFVTFVTIDFKRFILYKNRSSSNCVLFDLKFNIWHLRERISKRTNRRKVIWFGNFEKYISIFVSNNTIFFICIKCAFYRMSEE
jgi:hypothetical protein